MAFHWFRFRKAALHHDAVEHQHGYGGLTKFFHWAIVALFAFQFAAANIMLRNPGSQFPAADLGREDLAWFLVYFEGRPVGVLRTLFDPPLLQYARYGAAARPACRCGEVSQPEPHRRSGRFAVAAGHRGNVMLAAALMRAATQEMVARGYTHVITDVFEDDPHSPLGFHTRVMGFRPVATHDQGELDCKSRRITLLLDLESSYRRLRARGNWIYRYLMARWPDALHQRFAA